ncbi:MAG TPA: sigma-70 family RNA polymerase sigma factor [Solirubrobacteraceae bacterium]
MLHSQTDERLAALAQTGSDAAFEAIVARHRHKLVRQCARVVGDTDAEEAVQNAIISAHLALARGDRIQNLAPWLRAIARNASLNILRARVVRPEYPDDGRQLAEAHDDPVDRREQFGELVAAVQALPQRQRHAIVMRELEGRSYDEIAERLGSTNGAVRQLLNRARMAIRDRLAVLPGLEPLTRWLAGGSAGATSARIGALAGGCTLSAKLCASALVPAVIAGGAGGVVLPSSSSPAAHPRTSRIASRGAATATVVRRGSVGVSRPVAHVTAPVHAVARMTRATTATHTAVAVVRVTNVDRPIPQVTVRAAPIAGKKPTSTKTPASQTPASQTPASQTPASQTPASPAMRPQQPSPATPPAPATRPASDTQRRPSPAAQPATANPELSGSGSTPRTQNQNVRS